MRRPSGFSPSLPWLALLGAVLAFFGANVGRNWDFTVDDAGISYAYARNLWRGHGLVLTPGAERVEAATNFLWVLLLSPADGLGITHETLSKVLGLAFSSFALCAIALFPSVAYRRKPRYFDLLAPLVAATFAHFTLWTAAGLENGLFAFLASTTLVAVAWEEHDERRFPWSALLLGLLFATRPDGALYAAAVGMARGARIASGRPRRQDLRWGLVLLLCFGALELFRIAYFAWPLPNSFYTKRRTFDFGKDLTKFDSAGWQYVRHFADTYVLVRPLAFAPVLLLAMRAPIARLALALCVAAGFFFPVYSHGDWMDEWRFLSLVAPLMALAFAEAVRAASRVLVVLSPRSLRAPVAIVLTPIAAWALLRETTHSHPARFAATHHHDTLEFSFVRGRARYFAAAAQRLDVRHGSVLDPDVGGMSYDSGLDVVDLFGLGDVAIARTHPQDEPGMREAIFRERRPTFIHLHGAWFASVSLERLEELQDGYFRLPSVIAMEHEDASNYVRRETLAAPWTEEVQPGPLFSPGPGSRIEGFTLSAHGLEPAGTLRVEVTFSNLTQGTAGSIVAEIPGNPARIAVPLHPFGDLLASTVLAAGERPVARANVVLPAGRYEIRWRNDHAEATLGTVVVAAGEGRRDLAALRTQMRDLLRAGRVHEARRVALAVHLRGTLDAEREAREIEHLYARSLASFALRLSEAANFEVAASTAAEALRFGDGDSETRALVQRAAERMAERSRTAERAGRIEESFTLARDAVLLDPQRSWMRRRAENLRARRRNDYDGGRDVAGYRAAAWSLAHLHDPTDGPLEFDNAIILLGTLSRFSEAAALVDRAGVEPQAAWARVVAARGYLSRNELAEAQRLVTTVPCVSAWDPVFARAFAFAGGSATAGAPGCSASPAAIAWSAPQAPFDVLEGSFEGPRYVGWTRTGNAFDLGPVHDLPTGETFVNGWRGQRYATSFNAGGDAGTGVLRSRTFTIRAPAMSFLVGGGSSVEEVGVRLIVDGQNVVHAAGSDSEGMHRVFWDLRTWVGRQAAIEIYDTGTGGWGHIMADDFVAEPVFPRR